MSTFKPFYGTQVKDHVRGRWLEVYSYVAPELNHAIDKLGKHVTCPIHGTSSKSGKGDGFRLRTRDAAESGYGVCNSCGVFSDGFALLKALKGWDYYTSTIAIAQALGIKPLNSPDDYKAKKGKYTEKKDSPSISEELPQASTEVDTNSEPLEISPIPPPTPERLREIREKQEKLAETSLKYAQQAKAKIEQVWNESVSFDDGLPKPIFKWLKHRGVLLSKAVLCTGDNFRYHPALPYYAEDDNERRILVGNFPALIAAIRNLDGEIITLHRTYLTMDGFKAPVDEPRKMMPIPGEFVGGAIQLGGFPTAGVLGVGEGFETSASPLKVYGIPTWSLVNTTFMSFFTPPPGVHTLLIWADKDASKGGETAALALKERVEKMGLTAHILLPKRSLDDKKSVDWNDVLLKEGIFGFPQWGDINRILQSKKASSNL